MYKSTSLNLDLLGAVHKLRHAEGGGGGGGGGLSASVTMYTLSIHQYGIMCDEREGGSKIACMT